MQQVCDLIARREYKTALVRLWHLAEQLGDAGGTTLDRWASLPVDALADKRIDNFFTFGQPGITPVSYTHLDVYKRQAHYCEKFIQS